MLSWNFQEIFHVSPNGAEMFENSRLETLSHPGSQIDRMSTTTQLCC